MAFMQCPQLPSMSSRPTKPCNASPMTPHMGSRREKRRRPKPSPSQQPANGTPRRIDMTNTTASLRSQLSEARAASIPSTPTRPLERTKFRRKRSVEPRRPSTEQDLTPGAYAVAPDPLLLIDGYNVVGAWPRLRKHRDRADMEAARQLLIDDVVEFSCARGWDCVLVFDAMGTGEPEKDEGDAHVSVVFTGGETADTYIERAVYRSCEEGTRQVWAATSDVAQLRFTLAKGAHVMSSSLFVQEMKRVKRETREKVAERDETSARSRMLIANVDAATRDGLYRLRDGVYPERKKEKGKGKEKDGAEDGAGVRPKRER